MHLRFRLVGCSAWLVTLEAPNTRAPYSAHTDTILGVIIITRPKCVEFAYDEASSLIQHSH
jgi:hypothetical protein